LLTTTESFENEKIINKHPKGTYCSFPTTRKPVADTAFCLPDRKCLGCGIRYFLLGKLHPQRFDEGMVHCSRPMVRGAGSSKADLKN
jgi:hypothetical protein